MASHTLAWNHHSQTAFLYSCALGQILYSGGSIVANRGCMVRRVLFTVVILLLSIINTAYAGTLAADTTAITITEGGSGSFSVQYNSTPVIANVFKDVNPTAVSVSPVLIPSLGPAWTLITVTAVEDADTVNGLAVIRVNGGGENVSINVTIIDNDTVTAAEKKEEKSEEKRDVIVSNAGATQMASLVSSMFFMKPVMPKGNQPVVPPPADLEKTDLTNQANPALADMPVATTWDLNLTSAARYSHSTWYDFGHAESDRMGLSLHTAHQWDRLSIGTPILMPVVDFTDQLSDYNYTQVGISVIPRFALLNEAEHGLNLTAGLTGYYIRSFMATDEFYNPDHAGLGAMIGLQKTFEKCVLSGGLIAQRSWNFDNQNELSGQVFVDMITTGINIGVPIGDNWAVNGGLLYNHTSKMPDWIDANTMNASLGVNYILKDIWSIDLTVMTDLANEDEKTLQLHFGLGWSF